MLTCDRSLHHQPLRRMSVSWPHPASWTLQDSFLSLRSRTHNLEGTGPQWPRPPLPGKARKLGLSTSPKTVWALMQHLDTEEKFQQKREDSGMVEKSGWWNTGASLPWVLPEAHRVCETQPCRFLREEPACGGRRRDRGGKSIKTFVEEQESSIDPLREIHSPPPIFPEASSWEHRFWVESGHKPSARVICWPQGNRASRPQTSLQVANHQRCKRVCSHVQAGHLAHVILHTLSHISSMSGCAFVYLTGSYWIEYRNTVSISTAGYPESQR